MEHDSKRRCIDWGAVAGSEGDVGISNPGPSPRLLSSVLAAVDELSSCRDADGVLRRAVELARERLNLERVAIFIEDESRSQMLGTWGTDLNGETTDEHHFTYRYGALDRQVHEKALTGAARWLVLNDAPLLAQVDSEPFIAERGWIAVTAIRSATRSLGVMYNDTAISRRPINDAQQTRLAVYCYLLGGILERHLHTEGNQVEGNAADSLQRGRAELSPTLGPLVRKVVGALQEDASLDGKALAQRIGVSEGHLNRRFRKAMGVSVVDYRNRLRIEAFLRIVEAGESNLHSAAEAAGFGSYAQFHRVFRSTLGASPREYLTGERDEREPGST